MGITRSNFFLIQAAVGDDVFFVVPCGDAGALDGDAHRAAVVGAVEQEVLSNSASPATKPERSPGTLERLERLVNITILRLPRPTALPPVSRLWVCCRRNRFRNSIRRKR